MPDIQVSPAEFARLKAMPVGVVSVQAYDAFSNSNREVLLINGVVVHAR